MTEKLIIIDDSSTSLNLLKTAFATNGWEVYGAASVKNAFNLIYSVAPDLIITDAIMPQIGGFQFLKMKREDNLVSEIPVIVYSVLPESNAKFYVKEKLGEYFLPKNEDPSGLLKLASSVVKKHKLSDEYKENILSAKLKKEEKEENSKEDNTEPEQEEIKAPEEEIDKNLLEYEFKEKYNFSNSDKKIFADIFPLLYKILNYNLCVISVDYFEKKEKTIFCDIKDIILSPILQKYLQEKYVASDIILFKKYSPNLKMIVNEGEFSSKLEFNFEYKGENIANIVFYSNEENKWRNENNKEILEEILFRFFKARYINKKATVNKKDNFADRYLSNIFDFNFLNKGETINLEMYICIVDILNYADIEKSIGSFEIDVLSSKISEKIINCLDGNEQVYKNDVDEYVVLLYAKNKTQAQYKMNCILGILNQVKVEDDALDVVIGATNCMINGSCNIYEAQKKAREAIEKANKTEKVVIEE